MATIQVTDVCTCCGRSKTAYFDVDLSDGITSRLVTRPVQLALDDIRKCQDCHTPGHYLDSHKVVSAQPEVKPRRRQREQFTSA